MGEMISATAEVSRVENDIRSTFDTATARGGEVAAAAAARLGPAMMAIDNAVALRVAADKAESAAWVLVLAEDASSDPFIGKLRDMMWYALGRPKHSAHLDEVFPEGIGTYTTGDPRGQPLLMQVLETRILSGSAPQWTEDKRIGWAAEVKAFREPYAAAVEAHRPTEAATMVAEAGYRAAVRGGHARLRSFKRDLKSLGLTEAQIHDIIPNAGRHGGKGKGSEAGTGGGGKTEASGKTEGGKTEGGGDSVGKGGSEGGPPK